MNNRKTVFSFQSLSREQILADLALSRKQYEAGDYQDFDEAIAEIGAEYGIDPDPHQEIVDRFLEENNPYEPSKPLHIDLRKYVQYAREHHIRDPKDIPDEILDQFMIEQEPEKNAL